MKDENKFIFLLRVCEHLTTALTAVCTQRRWPLRSEKLRAPQFPPGFPPALLCTGNQQKMRVHGGSLARVLVQFEASAH